MPTTRTKSTDGGWSWVVLSSAFVISFIVGGVAFSFGLLQLEILVTFSSGRGETAWVGSLLFGMQHAAGPLASALLKRYSCKMVTCLGALMGTLGLLTGSFATRLLHLYLTVGIVTGVGFAMVFLCANVSVMQHFERRRALAIGLVAGAAGIGSFIFNPVVKYLVERYTWRGAILIEAGVVMNCLVCGALLRPVEGATEDRARETLRKNQAESDLEIKERESCECKNSNETKINEDKSSYESNDDVHCKETTQLSAMAESQPGEVKVIVTKSLLTAKQNLPTSRFVRLRSSLSRLLSDLFHVALLRDPIFLLTYLATFVRSLPMYIPFAYLPDLAATLDIPGGQAVWLLSVFGIINAAGRPLTGAIVGKLELNPVPVYTAAILTSGCICLLVPVMKTFELLMTYTVLLGVVSSTLRPLAPLVLAKLFGTKSIADSFGLLMTAIGLAIFTGPTLAGALYDWTGSFDLTFISAGAEFIVGGLLMVLVQILPRLRKFRRHRFQQKPPDVS